MSLKSILLSKKASHKGPQIVWSYLDEISKTGKSIETENKLVVA